VPAIAPYSTLTLISERVPVPDLRRIITYPISSLLENVCFIGHLTLKISLKNSPVVSVSLVYRVVANGMLNVY
jgi:hypothetical protein